MRAGDQKLRYNLEWPNLRSPPCEPEPEPCGAITAIINISHLSSDDCVVCSFSIDYLHPDSPIHMFVVYFCEHRKDAFYDLCGAFDIPDDVRVKIKESNASMKLQCFDVLHRVYHRDNKLTLAMIMMKLSESNDAKLQQIISDYHPD